MSDDLLDVFADWLDAGDDADDGTELVNHAATFLSWRADAPLETLNDDDVLTFLIDWCPHRLGLSVELADTVCQAVVEFTYFLGCTGRLRGGHEHGRSLARRANTLRAGMRAVIAERARSCITGAPDLTEADLDTLASVVFAAQREQRSSLLVAWKPSLSAAERAGIVAGSITDATDARTRLIGLQLLVLFDPDVAEPYMRQLLDTAAAGHAAIWLLDHGLAEPETVGGFITPAIMLDILSQMVDYPDALCEQFLGGHDPHRMLEFFWRHPAPESAPVLDALGRHLPDRALAKQARRAAINHRNWLANNR